MHLFALLSHLGCQLWGMQLITDMCDMLGRPCMGGCKGKCEAVFHLASVLKACMSGVCLGPGVFAETCRAQGVCRDMQGSLGCPQRVYAETGRGSNVCTWSGAFAERDRALGMTWAYCFAKLGLLILRGGPGVESCFVFLNTQGATCVPRAAPGHCNAATRCCFKMCLPQ